MTLYKKQCLIFKKNDIYSTKLSKLGISKNLNSVLIFKLKMNNCLQNLITERNLLIYPLDTKILHAKIKLSRKQDVKDLHFT